MERTAVGPVSGLSVLVVEDEFLIAVEAQRIVEEAGIGHAILAASVDAARECLNGDPPPNVAVLDMRLGDGDGGVLIGLLRARNVPIVIASALGPEPDVALPADLIVIRKPYRDSDLVAAIAAALANRSPNV